MIWYIHIPFLLLVVFFLLKYNRPELRVIMLATWVAKLIAGLSVGLLYNYYYEVGDTIALFNDSLQLGKQWLDPGFKTAFHYADDPRAWTFVQWTAPLVILCGGNYWLTTLWLAFFSWGALWLLTLRLYRYLGQSAFLLAIIAFHAWPSVVFWSAGYLKESVAMIFMAFIFMALIDLLYSKKISLISVVGLLCFVPLFLLKYYYAALIGGVLLPGALAMRLLKQRSTWSKYVLFIVLVGSVGFVMTTLHPNLSAEHFINALVTNHEATAALSEHHQMVHFYDLENDLLSIVYNFPYAVISGLFRPFITDAFHPLSYLAAVEHTLLLFMVLWSMIRQVKERCWPGFLGFVLILFVILSAGLLAIASPNFGSLMRYKVVFLPILIFMLLHGVRKVRNW